MIRRPITSDFQQRRTRVKRTVRTLLTPEQMDQAIVRESARVDRKSGGALTLVLFRIPAQNRTRLSAIRLAKTIVKRIRVTDDVGWFDDEHLGLLLPETTTAGAWRLATSICDIVAKRSERPLCTLYTYGDDQQAPSVLRSTDPARKMAS
jgi:hypothetical protein